MTDELQIDLDAFKQNNQESLADLEKLSQSRGPHTKELYGSAAGEVEEDLQKFLQGVVDRIRQAGSEPAEVFRGGLRELGAVERRIFVMMNMLEQVKSGKSLGPVAQSYRKLGLLPNQASATTSPRTHLAAHGDNDAPVAEGVGAFLMRGIQTLRKGALLLAKISVNAVKTIPKLVTIKPKLSLTFPIPTLGFEIEAGDISVAELWAQLLAGLDMTEV